MRVYHNQLNNTLNQGVKPVWLIFGDEPWQKDDALKQIKNHAEQQGFSEVIRFSADDKFDWSQVIEEYNAMSLFASSRIIEVDLSSGKPNEQGQKSLIELAQRLVPDVILLLHGPKLDANTQKRKWFKALDKDGVFLPVYDIEGKQLNQWILRQAQQKQLSLNADLVQMLMELFEGNLPALSQELDKLALLFQGQQLSVEMAESVVIKQAKFNPFQLTDALLVNDTKRCLSMLEQLKHEGAAVAQILWILHKEVSQLLDMQEAMAAGTPLSTLFQTYRIWEKRKPLYQKALSSIPTQHLSLALGRIAQADKLSKTATEFDPFVLLADICVSLKHGDSMKHFSLDYEH